MKRLALLFVLISLPATAQQVIKPTTADYRYEESVVVNLYITNWYIDFHYANLQQGRTYRRQVSEDGRWRYEGAVIVVPEIPGATASFSEGIDIRPVPPPIHFFRLTVEPTNSPPALKRQMDLVMADQPVEKRVFGLFGSKRKFRKEITIDVPPNGKLRFTPTKVKKGTK